MTNVWCWEFGSSPLLKKGKTNNIVTVKLEKNSNLFNIVKQNHEVEILGTLSPSLISLWAISVSLFVQNHDVFALFLLKRHVFGKTRIYIPGWPC